MWTSMGSEPEVPGEEHGAAGGRRRVALVHLIEVPLVGDVEDVQAKLDVLPREIRGGEITLGIGGQRVGVVAVGGAVTGVGHAATHLPSRGEVVRRPQGEAVL